MLLNITSTKLTIAKLVVTLIKLNLLLMIVYNMSGYISEENGEKFLIINKDDPVSQKYNSIFSALKSFIVSKEGKNITFHDGYDKIKFLSDADLVLDKLLYFTKSVFVIRFVFKQENLFYPQVYFDNGRYQL